MIYACVSGICSLSILFLISMVLAYSMTRFISLVLLGMCACVVSVVMWSFGLFVSIYWYPMWMALVHVTVMCVLLFELHMCILRECEGSMVTVMLV